MTRLFGIIGHPIGHSLSPVMHGAALRAIRFDALYAAFDVPAHDLKPVLRALVLCGVEGLNVTVPLKEAVVPLLDRLDSSASATGAVNTIVVRDRRLCGHNTDGAGLMRALHELGWRPGAGRAVILGAGGAARAAAWELARAGRLAVTIANRHPARASSLVRWLARAHPRASVQAASLRDVRLDGAQLLINATTVGMRPGDGPPVGLSGLGRRAFVYDLIYHRETELVRRARRRGCVAANGLSMLVYQGAESLRLWTGRAAPLAAMRKAAEGALRRRMAAEADADRAAR